MRTPALIFTLLLTASIAHGQSVSDRALTQALRADPADVPALIQGLVDLADTFQVPSAQLTRCLNAAGLRQDPFLDGLLANARSVQIDRGKVVIRFSEATHLPMNDTDGSTLGWLHLDETVSFQVADRGRALDRIRGLKVSRSKNGFRGELLSLQIGATTISVRAGKFSMPLFSKTFVVSQAGNATGMSGRVGG